MEVILARQSPTEWRLTEGDEERSRHTNSDETLRHEPRPQGAVSELTWESARA